MGPPSRMQVLDVETRTICLWVKFSPSRIGETAGSFWERPEDGELLWEATF